jgi:hypothetical protein
MVLMFLSPKEQHKGVEAERAWVVERGALVAAAGVVAALVVHVDHASLAVVAAVARRRLPRVVEGRVLVAALRGAPARFDINHALQTARESKKKLLSLMMSRVI